MPQQKEMNLFHEKSVVMSLISAFFFAIFYMASLLGREKYVGPYPLWFSIIGAIFMCYYPIWAVRSGSPRMAFWFAMLTMLISGLLLLSLFGLFN